MFFKKEKQKVPKYELITIDEEKEIDSWVVEFTIKANDNLLDRLIINIDTEFSWNSGFYNPGYLLELMLNVPLVNFIRLGDYGVIREKILSYKILLKNKKTIKVPKQIKKLIE